MKQFNMRHILKNTLACLVLFAVPLSHAWSDLGSMAASVVNISDTAAVKFIWTNIDIIGLVWATVKHTLLFLVFSLLVLFFCRKRRWFKRANPIWDKFTYLYYLYIPVVFMALGAVYGALSNMEQQSFSIIKDKLAPPVNSFLISSLNDLPADYHDALAQMTPEDALQYTRVIIETSLDKTLKEGTSRIADFWQKLPGDGRTFIVDVCVDIVLGKVAGIVGLSRGEVKQGLNAMKKENFLDLIKQGGDLFGDYAAAKVRGMIRGYRVFVMLIFVLALFVPVVDTLIARGREKTFPSSV
ncbi:MAG: hypothetical protein LBB76_05900 [Azoarcus sp.]|jgi:hypothetical protein|nr:hypothetical protein [Azoarcus sp.]